MYKSFFGLNRNPFDLSPDPSLYVSVEKEREVLASIYHAIVRRKGFVVLTGEVGTGKTLAVRYLCQLWKDQRIAFANIVGPRLSVIDFLNYVAFDLGLEVKDSSKGSLLRALYQFLLAQFEKGVTTVLVIDEAHQIRPQVLEEIRLLTNFETTQEKLLQVILVGQPELDTKLDSFELRQLKQRIAIRCRLEPLCLEDTRRYIERRLMLAGANLQANPIFPEKTVDAIFRYSSGIPRLINSICEQALVAAYARQDRVVPVEIIEEVASYFRLQPAADFGRAQPPFLLAEQGRSSIPQTYWQPAATVEATAAKALDSSSLSSHREAPTAPPAQPSKPETSLIATASREQEGVEPLATTATVTDLSVIEAEKYGSTSTSITNFSSVSEPSAPTRELRAVAQTDLNSASVAGTSEKAQELVVATARLAQQSDGADSRLTTDTILASPKPVSWQSLSTGLESVIAADTKDTKNSSTPWQNVRLAAAGIALLSVLGASVIFLLRSGVTENAAGKPAHELAAPPVATHADESFAPRAAQSNLHSAMRPGAKPNPGRAAGEATPTVTRKPANEVVTSERPEQPSFPAKRPALSSSDMLNAHPVWPLDRSAGWVTPVMDAASPSEEKALAAITSAVDTRALPPPRVQADAPLPVGGRIKEPQILSRVLPAYPPLAQQAHTEGDVVVEVVVDKAGNVGDLRVISGPPVLRQAALDAVRRWKYAPSTLDAQPISVQMLVTIRFRR